jgi:hypothetical protein
MEPHNYVLLLPNKVKPWVFFLCIRFIYNERIMGRTCLIFRLSVCSICKTTEWISIEIFLKELKFWSHRSNITDSMEQTPSWGANSHSASQEIPRLLWTQKLITLFTRGGHWSLYQSNESNPQRPTLFLPKIHSNILLPSTPRSSECSLPFTLPD